MLLLILNGARVPLSKGFPSSHELLAAAPFEKSPYGPMNLCKSVNRNTSEINVPECRRPADPYIERTRICVLTRSNFCLAAMVPKGKGWFRDQRERARILNEIITWYNLVNLHRFIAGKNCFQKQFQSRG